MLAMVPSLLSRYALWWVLHAIDRATDVCMFNLLFCKLKFFVMCMYGDPNVVCPC